MSFVERSLSWPSFVAGSTDAAADTCTGGFKLVLAA